MKNTMLISLAALLLASCTKSKSDQDKFGDAFPDIGSYSLSTPRNATPVYTASITKKGEMGIQASPYTSVGTGAFNLVISGSSQTSDNPQYAVNIYNYKKDSLVASGVLGRHFDFTKQKYYYVMTIGSNASVHSGIYTDTLK